MVATDTMADRRGHVWLNLLQHGRYFLLLLSSPSSQGHYQRSGSRWLDGKHARYPVNKTQFFKDHKPLPDSEKIRSRAGRHKDGGRCAPAQLLADFKGCGLVAIGLIRLQIMYRRPAQLSFNTVGQGVELSQVADRGENLGTIGTDLHVLFHVDGCILTGHASRAK